MKFIPLVILVAVSQCDTKVKSDSACQVIKDILYPNCEFSFSKKEIANLSPENKDKLTAAKVFFRSCPQAKKCLTQPR